MIVCVRVFFYLFLFFSYNATQFVDDCWLNVRLHVFGAIAFILNLVRVRPPLASNCDHNNINQKRIHHYIKVYARNRAAEAAQTTKACKTTSITDHPGGVIPFELATNCGYT